MKITPLDIQQMRFRVRLRGYDRREVDQFLEELSRAVEGLNRENATLRDRLAGADAQLAELKKAETTLAHTLVSAQTLTDDLKQAAQRDAELIMKEAELKASELLQEARMEMAGLQRDLSDLHKQRLLAIERLRSTLRTFERMLEIETGDEETSHQAEQASKIAGNSDL
jgi:cell division initiation protein